MTIKQLGKDFVKSLLDVQLIWLYEDNPRVQVAAGRRWMGRVQRFQWILILCIVVVVLLAKNEVDFWVARHLFSVVVILLILFGCSSYILDYLKRRIASLRRNRL